MSRLAAAARRETGRTHRIASRDPPCCICKRDAPAANARAIASIVRELEARLALWRRAAIPLPSTRTACRLPPGRTQATVSAREEPIELDARSSATVSARVNPSLPTPSTPARRARCNCPGRTPGAKFRARPGRDARRERPHSQCRAESRDRRKACPETCPELCKFDLI